MKKGFFIILLFGVEIGIFATVVDGVTVADDATGGVLSRLNKAPTDILANAQPANYTNTQATLNQYVAYKYTPSMIITDAQAGKLNSLVWDRLGLVENYLGRLALQMAVSFAPQADETPTQKLSASAITQPSLAQNAPQTPLAQMCAEGSKMARYIRGLFMQGGVSPVDTFNGIVVMLNAPMIGISADNPDAPASQQIMEQSRTFTSNSGNKIVAKIVGQSLQNVSEDSRFYQGSTTTFNPQGGSGFSAFVATPQGGPDSWSGGNSSGGVTGKFRTMTMDVQRLIVGNAPEVGNLSIGQPAGPYTVTVQEMIKGDGSIAAIPSIQLTAQGDVSAVDGLPQQLVGSSIGFGDFFSLEAAGIPIPWALVLVVQNYEPDTDTMNKLNGTTPVDTQEQALLARQWVTWKDDSGNVLGYVSALPEVAVVGAVRLNPLDYPLQYQGYAAQGALGNNFSEAVVYNAPKKLYDQIVAASADLTTPTASSLTASYTGACGSTATVTLDVATYIDKENWAKCKCDGLLVSTQNTRGRFIDAFQGSMMAMQQLYVTKEMIEGSVSNSAEQNVNTPPLWILMNPANTSGPLQAISGFIPSPSTKDSNGNLIANFPQTSDGSKYVPIMQLQIPMWTLPEASSSGSGT